MAQLFRHPVKLHDRGDRVDRTGKGLSPGQGVVRRLDADEDRQTEAKLAGIGKCDATGENARRVTKLLDLIQLPDIGARCHQRMMQAETDQWSRFGVALTSALVWALASTRLEATDHTANLAVTAPERDCLSLAFALSSPDAGRPVGLPQRRLSV